MNVKLKNYFNIIFKIDGMAMSGNTDEIILRIKILIDKVAVINFRHGIIKINEGYSTISGYENSILNPKIIWKLKDLKV